MKNKFIWNLIALFILTVFEPAFGQTSPRYNSRASKTIKQQSKSKFSKNTQRKLNPNRVDPSKIYKEEKKQYAVVLESVTCVSAGELDNDVELYGRIDLVINTGRGGFSHTFLRRSSRSPEIIEEGETKNYDHYFYFETYPSALRGSHVFVDACPSFRERDPVTDDNLRWRNSRDKPYLYRDGDELGETKTLLITDNNGTIIEFRMRLEEATALR